MSNLTLEIQVQADKTAVAGPVMMMMTPINEDYWAYRVRLSETQAIVAFPKFMTVGVGFAQEEDRDTNLPYTCGTEEIYAHIEHNKGDDEISRDDCLAAIRMVQDAVKAERAR